jgi:hypothetical protein
MDSHDTRNLCEQTLAIRATPLGHLRWSALGFQYDWTARKYPQTFTSLENPDALPPIPEQVFPPNLAQVVKNITKAVASHSDSISDLEMTIEPEASIVNYCLVNFLICSPFLLVRSLEVSWVVMLTMRN